VLPGTDREASDTTRTLVEEFARSVRARYDLDAVRVWLLDPPDVEAGRLSPVLTATGHPHGELSEAVVLDELRTPEPRPIHRGEFAGFPLVTGDVRVGYVETYDADGFAPEVLSEMEHCATRLAATLCSANAARASESASRGTILVCDDDPGVRALLALVLTKRGFKVLQAENGLLALEQAKHARPDLILIDWVMPIMDGRETVEQLKRDAQTRDIPVVMLTSQSTVDDKVAALESGARDFLTKPFDQRELVARLEQQMRWRKLLAEVGPAATEADAAPRSGDGERDALARAIRDAERFIAEQQFTHAGNAYRDAALAAGRMRDAALANRLLRLAGTMFLSAAERSSEARAIQDGYLHAARCFLITGNLRLAKRSIDAALGEDD
jgi:DNA-binding response OmpR family regulator